MATDDPGPSVVWKEGPHRKSRPVVDRAKCIVSSAGGFQARLPEEAGDTGLRC
jgi:hypothetical protein